MKAIIISVSIFLMLGNLWAVNITQDSRYIYYIIPAQELIDDDLVTAIEESKKVVLDVLREKIPEGQLTSATLDSLNKFNKKEFIEIMNNLNQALPSRYDRFWDKNDTVPTGFMFLLGTKISANLRIGGGASATAALVFVPTLVYRIDKITQEVEKSYKLQVAISIYPAIDIGGGVGGGTRGRIGVGFIWGSLDNPRDFSGASLSASSSVAIFGGVNIKVGTVRGLHGIKNVYAMAQFEKGLVCSAELHGNIGYIIAFHDMKFTTLGKLVGYEEVSKYKVQEPAIIRRDEAATGIEQRDFRR